MSDFTKEIKAGRSLRVWIAEDCLLKDKNLDKRTIRLEQPLEVFDSHNPTYVPVILTLPPKPLEVRGFMCDRLPAGRAVCAGYQHCRYPENEDSCQPVTLVEKGENCQCQE